MNQSLAILTGATAGATESFVVVPFRSRSDYKTRRQNSMVWGSGQRYCSEKMVLGLYKGLESTLWNISGGMQVILDVFTK